MWPRAVGQWSPPASLCTGHRYRATAYNIVRRSMRTLDLAYLSISKEVAGAPGQRDCLRLGSQQFLVLALQRLCTDLFVFCQLCGQLFHPAYANRAHMRILALI